MISAEDSMSMPQIGEGMKKSTNSCTNLKEQQYLSQKERTLFCVNIDQRCSENILYELFLQVGPIDNITRKADKNGNLICLITYKHLESCEYAIKLFNGLSLFNQSLKVQFSQNPNAGQNNRGSSTNLSSIQSVNHYQNLNSSSNGSYNNNTNNSNSNNRDQNRNRQSFDNNLNNQQPQQIDQQQLLSLVFNQFSSGLQNPFIQNQINMQNNPMPSLMSNQFNRSKSGPNLHNDSNDQSSRYNNHQSRRNFDRPQGGNYNNGNGNNYNSNDNRRDSSRNNYQGNNMQSREYNRNHSMRDDNRDRRSRSPSYKRRR